MIKAVDNGKRLTRQPTLPTSENSFMKSLLYPVLCLILIGCTYSVNMIITDGTASDMVDETQSPSTTTSPSLSVPETLLP